MVIWCETKAMHDNEYNSPHSVKIPHFFCVCLGLQMAGSDLVGAEVRRQVGQTILALQRGGYSAGDGVPLESLAAAAAGLGGERKSMLDAAGAESMSPCRQV